MGLFSWLFRRRHKESTIEASVRANPSLNKAGKQLGPIAVAPMAYWSDTAGIEDVSLEALKSIDVKAIRDKVARVVADAGFNGITTDEAETVLGMSHQTVSPRFTELRRDGEIYRTGDKRPTRSGRKAWVYCMTPSIASCLAAAI